MPTTEAGCSSSYSESQSDAKGTDLQTLFVGLQRPFARLHLPFACVQMAIAGLQTAFVGRYPNSGIRRVTTWIL